MQRGDSKEKIADDLLEDVKKIELIYEVIKDSPDSTKEQIYDQIREK